MDLTAFEAERARLAAIATRVLGSSADTDDVLQEARIRFAGADGIDDAPAWLTTIVTRLCLDHLRKRRTSTNAEVAVPADVAGVDPEADALLAERVGGAMQVVFDTLAPAERAAFVLHDVFGYPFEAISEVLGRSGAAVRQLASRARRKLQGSPEPVGTADNARVVDAFLTAARGGELATLVSLLAPEVVMRADLVGQQIGAAAVLEGAAVAQRFNGSKGALPVTIDGERGAAWIMAGDVKVAFVFHVEAGLVHEIELIADPDVLATLDITRRR
jgi:RNA polymerase sigma factor (sigma-70 family)